MKADIICFNGQHASACTNKGVLSLESMPTYLCHSTSCYIKQEALKKQHCAKGGTNMCEVGVSSREKKSMAGIWE